MNKESDDKIEVHYSDLDKLNKLTQTGDNARRNLTTALITIYGAAISGLFYIITSTNNTSIADNKLNILVICLSALLIIFLCISEKLIDYFATQQIGNEFVSHIKAGSTFNMTGRPESLTPKPWTVFCLKWIPVLLFVLIGLNGISVAVYFIQKLY